MLGRIITGFACLTYADNAPERVTGKGWFALQTPSGCSNR